MEGKSRKVKRKEMVKELQGKGRRYKESRIYLDFDAL